MIKSLIMIVAIGALAFIYTDMESASVFYSIILPVIDFFVFISIGFWFIALFQKLGVKQSMNSSGGDSGCFGGFDSG